MHPYKQLDGRAFWATAVARRNMLDISQLWAPRHVFGPEAKVATFGSCFAQHIGRALAKRGFNWYVAEKAPAALSPESRKKFNYDVFSARTGNIYTASLLKQWVSWAAGAEQPDEIWEQEGRFYDPFRPGIEPNGFASVEELLASRQEAIRAFGAIIANADVFVFTLGLTESWFNSARGYEYPMCPGVVAGEFDPGRHTFVNQDYDLIAKALDEAIGMMHAANPELKVLLTVSPVPLTATNSGHHVLVATMESKSILRAVAGSLARRHAFVDYFPSYEIVSSPPFRGAFFGPNGREVTAEGVNHVMAQFFQCLGVGAASVAPTATLSDESVATAEDDVVCDEALLEAFAGEPHSAQE